MIKQKKYKDQWERLIHLKYEVNKIKENIILKDVFLFTTVFFTFISLITYYRYSIKLDFLSTSETLNSIVFLFIIGGGFIFSNNKRIDKVDEDTFHFREIEILSNLLSCNQALIEGYELIEENIKGKRFIEDFILRSSNVNYLS